MEKDMVRNHEDQLIRQMKKRLLVEGYEWVERISEETLAQAEAQRGFGFPPLLRRLYPEVGDGAFGLSPLDRESQTNFTWATLHGANVEEAHVTHTIFGDVDLSEVKGLETLKHWRPSVIDIRTLARSSGHISERFLVEAGVDRAIIPQLLALFRPYHGHATKWYSEIEPVPPWLTTECPQEAPEPERADFRWENDHYFIDDSE